jgi:hypothetical protein
MRKAKNSCLVDEEIIKTWNSNCDRQRIVAGLMKKPLRLEKQRRKAENGRGLDEESSMTWYISGER